MNGGDDGTPRPGTAPGEVDPVNEQNSAELPRAKERLASALAELDPPDIEELLAAMAALRSTLAPGLASPGASGNDASDEWQGFLELNAFLDRLVGDRLRRLFDQLYLEARRDPLTGLGERRAFTERLGLEIDRSRRYGRNFALMIFDLDRFKSVNDRDGHPTGDRLLIELAGILRGALRQSDEAFRIGGDEFAAILPETRLTSGAEIGGRLASALASSGWTGRCGISWGVANWPTDIDENLPGSPPSGAPVSSAEAAQLVAIADERLYRHKSRNGRGGEKAGSRYRPRTGAVN